MLKFPQPEINFAGSREEVGWEEKKLKAREPRVDYFSAWSPFYHKSIPSRK